MKGAKKAQFIATGKTEEEYYQHARNVCDKRHFNMKMGQILSYYDWNPLRQLALYDSPAPEELEQEAERLQWMWQDCECPMSILREYLQHVLDDSHQFTRPAHIARLLRRFPEASFLRFGDKNQISAKALERYCDPNGEPIDAQAINISELSGLEISEEDIVQFVIQHPKGTHTFKPESLADRLAKRFAELTGMRLTPDFASELIKRIEHHQLNPSEKVELPF